ncbi:hypothetical protein BASA81_010800 [Batrachochytrium salamandrivorans]|nr:hypothetical protein BASA81_010800 [Batrachochytrium salamandrivorans]
MLLARSVLTAGTGKRLVSVSSASSSLLFVQPWRPCFFSTSPSPPPSSPVDASTLVAGSKEGEGKKKPTIDKRVWPIALSTLAGGCAVGVLFPVMPIFVKELGLSSQDFGIVVSVIGLSRLALNIPAAWITDRYGRRTTLIGGPVISAVGMGLTSFASNLAELATFRFITGMGGSFQMTGAQMYLADISTKENRARTMAPMGIAFATGATLGPGLGGFLSEQYGLQAPFFFVTAAIASVVVLNYRLIPETKMVKHSPLDRTVWEEFQSVSSQWKPLLRNPDMRRILGLHMTYWAAQSGCVWTLLPLFASDKFSLSVSQLGGMFAMMSAIGIVGLGPSAYISDKLGRKFTIAPATLLVASALTLMPFATSQQELFGLVAVFATGSTLFNSTPSAFVSDITTEETRGQGLALLRSAGDAGLFVGASTFGALNHHTSPEITFGCASAAVLLAGGNFLLRK